MKVNYSSNYVAGFCLLPTYICAGLLLSNVSIFIWIAGMLVVLIACSAMYASLVLKPLQTHVAAWKRYLLTFVTQILFWVAVIYVGSIVG